MSQPSARAAAAPSGRAGRVGAASAACLAALLLSACQQTGDFGRKNPNVVNDTILPTVGTALAYSRSEPVSLYRMTDNENEMRDLAWGVVMPPLSEQWRGRVLSELRRTRILPAQYTRLGKDDYVRTLMSIDYTSSAARYSRLLDDVIVDTHRIEPFFRMASRVDTDDRARRRALETAQAVTTDERGAALARIEENGLMIAWTREAFENRLVVYRFALERLMIETPDPKSDEVAAALDAYAAVLGSLRPLGPPRGVFKS